VEKEKELIDCRAQLEEAQAFYENNSDLLKNQIELLNSKLSFYENSKTSKSLAEMSNLQVNLPLKN
jgi:hypothetical protein